MTHPDNNDVERVKTALEMARLFAIKHCNDKESMRLIGVLTDAKAALSALPTPNVAVADSLLRRLEPHLDAIVCYASTMDEHEPNRLAVDVREYLKANVAPQGGEALARLYAALVKEEDEYEASQGYGDECYDVTINVDFAGLLGYTTAEYQDMLKALAAAHLPTEAAKDDLVKRQASWNVAAREIGEQHASAYSAASIVHGGQLIEDMHNAFMALMLLKAKPHFDAKPEASVERKPRVFHGGNYQIRCRDCQQLQNWCDKRQPWCSACVDKWNASLTPGELSNKGEK
jgi:hypothetical protein